ncbi:MAG: GNAT family N-acetyltransferase [Akkermansiaceae bacterium]|nr:GNAT family N-acetyltransferase [Akkermansiaceae bacterium]
MSAHPFTGMNTISTDIEGRELREVFVESLEYQELLRLRFNELRKPLGLEWTEAEGEADKLDRHFGLYHREVLVGSVVVATLKTGFAKLRQIAVANSQQGHGVGKSLMAAIESFLAREGVKRFELHARVDVAGFYDSLAYHQQGQIFEEIGLPHVKMIKLLRRNESA